MDSIISKTESASNKNSIPMKPAGALGTRKSSKHID